MCLNYVGANVLPIAYTFKSKLKNILQWCMPIILETV